jgi:hypothetical protein
MIQIRLLWRQRARPSATLHEIPNLPSMQKESKLVLIIVQNGTAGVKRGFGRVVPEECADYPGDQKQDFNAENAKSAEPPSSSAFSARSAMEGFFAWVEH